MTYFGRLSVNTVSAHNSLPLKCDQAGSIDRRAAGHEHNSHETSTLYLSLSWYNLYLIRLLKSVINGNSMELYMWLAVMLTRTWPQGQGIRPMCNINIGSKLTMITNFIYL